jgi:CBS domain-containing protein
MATSRRPLIRDVMTPEAVTLSPTAKAAQAAKAMKSLNVGAIPIRDGKRLLGMVTDAISWCVSWRNTAIPKRRSSAVS